MPIRQQTLQQFFDLPFAFIFIAVMTWLSWILSIITIIFMLFIFILGMMSRQMIKNNLNKVTEASVKVMNFNHKSGIRHCKAL